MPANHSGILFDPPFEVHLPAHQRVPVVLNSPHSGCLYPAEFLKQSQLDPLALRRSEDSYTDELFAAVVRLGCPLLKARFPRAYLDVNREPYELDPAMFAGPLPGFVNSSSLRVAGGLGTVPRIVAEHLDIYEGLLEWDDVQARITELYFPYHARLGELLERTVDQFGWALLIDCHSMPSSVAAAGGFSLGARPGIILGDRYGCACAPAITGALEAHFSAHNFSVVRNKPYAGGYITQTYGQPASAVHAIQIEVNRGLYMEECTLKRTRGFGRLSRSLEAVMAGFFAELPGLVRPVRVAAE